MSVIFLSSTTGGYIASSISLIDSGQLRPIYRWFNRWYCFRCNHCINDSLFNSLYCCTINIFTEMVIDQFHSVGSGVLTILVREFVGSLPKKLA